MRKTSDTRGSRSNERIHPFLALQSCLGGEDHQRVIATSADYDELSVKFKNFTRLSKKKVPFRSVNCFLEEKKVEFRQVTMVGEASTIRCAHEG